MLKLKWSVLSTLIILSLVFCKTKIGDNEQDETILLKEKIGQMIMVGFRGTTVTPQDPIYKMIAENNIGGVVLYSRDLPSKETQKRNITSPTQLKKLNSDLQAIDETKLFISIDEEGGFVTRLSKEDGFQYHKSHQKIASLKNLDSTKLWAHNMAVELAELGINMNFGPVLDVNVNPKNPIIGARERSFSDSLEIVISNADIFLKEHQKQNIICVPKHFPGHGSSDKDTHKGLADVTNTWSKKELQPFKTFIENKSIQTIMTSHVYNANLDTLPATLSSKIIHQLLRKEYSYKGVIMSDDMQMRAISNFYDFETSIEKSIIAGVDILLFSNNAAPCASDNPDCEEIPFDPEIAIKAIDYILELVANGKISEERINESYNRIIKLKSGL